MKKPKKKKKKAQKKDGDDDFFNDATPAGDAVEKDLLFEGGDDEDFFAVDDAPEGQS